MDFNTIREFLIADEALHALVGDNIFLLERPEKYDCKDYITPESVKLKEGCNRMQKKGKVQQKCI